MRARSHGLQSALGARGMALINLQEALDAATKRDANADPSSSSLHTQATTFIKDDSLETAPCGTDTAWDALLSGAEAARVARMVKAARAEVKSYGVENLLEGRKRTVLARLEEDRAWRLGDHYAKKMALTQHEPYLAYTR